MSKRVDFSGNAPVYDRRHGALLPDDGIGRLWSTAGLEGGAHVLDVGAGTGRVAVPLSIRGFRVVGVEPSPGMLGQLLSKSQDLPLLAVAAEGSQLPFPSDCFDAVTVARLLYLTPDWKAILEEVRRVLSNGGCLLHEWGNGETDEEWVQIRERARTLFQQGGVPVPFHPGVRTEAEVVEWLASLGFAHEAQVLIGPGPETTLREFLRRLVEGELSYVWAVPDEVRGKTLPVLQQWAIETFDLDRSIPMPREIRWTIYRKHAG